MCIIEPIRQTISFSLADALLELKTLLRHEKKKLTPAEAVIFEHALSPDAGYLLKHSAWEICMKGTIGAHRDIILHAYVCRKVDPALVQGLDEWNSAMTGGNIPSAPTVSGWEARKVPLGKWTSQERSPRT